MVNGECGAVGAAGGLLGNQCHIRCDIAWNLSIDLLSMCVPLAFVGISWYQLNQLRLSSGTIAVPTCLPMLWTHTHTQIDI